MKPLIVTSGDPAGIGPEIVIKAVNAWHSLGKAQRPLLVSGDPEWFETLGKKLSITTKNVSFIPISWDKTDIKLGQVGKSSGQAGFESTSPSAPPAVRMMLVNPDLRVVLNSVHVALKDMIDALSTEGLLQTILLTEQACKQLGVPRPRIAVAGLNPHAGESGLFGSEDIDIIAPAITKAQSFGVEVSGPWPGDTIFMRAKNHRDFDVVIAQYHDQGLIPIKYLGIDQGVNITLGLPFIRTSVDHGTAFDIAGKNIASPDSLLAAIALADRLASQSEHPNQPLINH